MTLPRISLVDILLTDLTRNFTRVLLFLAVMGSAYAVVLSTQHNRQLSIEVEALMQEQDRLDVEWRHLVLEQSALTEHNRIETLVNKKLNMKRPDVNSEIVVKIK
jgi:cell division protein FtsL